ncbi:MAG: LLM class flavin-dependent oxidoreductase, partial [Thermomicrobiales bacterium]|nr:LLM class flavin-dependent oxidoreductase [Thermomicrobiales bacterium]
MPEPPLPTIEPLAPRVGFYVGSIVGGMRDGALRWADLAAMAHRAEEIGFDSFWLPDHLLFRFPDEPAHAPWECWSLLSALAATTNRLGIGSLVVCTGYRNPALLAKMADTVDEISGGRFTLGLGAGWHEPEFRAFGYPVDRPIDRFEEAVDLIRTLLREGRADHHGRYYDVREAELRPRGPHPQGPPLLIGALAGKPRMLRLAATYADVWNGWLVHGRSYADRVPPLRAAVDAACVAIGRDPATLQRTIGIAVDQRPGAAQPPARAHAGLAPDSSPPVRQPLTGAPEEIAAELRRFAAQGVALVQVAPVIDGVAGVEAMAPVLDLLR